MDEIKQIVLRFGLTLALIIGIFWFLKHRTSATIAADDKSMSEAAFPEGNYSVNTSALKPSDLKRGDAVAYRIASDLNTHVARVVAVEGQRVEIDAHGVSVEGAPYPLTFDFAKTHVPGIKVPRGCVYVLADFPQQAQDSLKVGPVPFSHILGTLTGSR